MSTEVANQSIIRPRRSNVSVFSISTWPMSWFIGITMLLSGWVSFSLPQRGAPGVDGGIDLLALAKLGVRGLVLGLVVWHLARLHYRPLALPEHARWRKRSLSFLTTATACMLFLAWAFVSAAWSPLKIVSIGQTAGLMSMFGLTWLIAVFCTTADHRRRVLHCLEQMLLLFSMTLLVCHLIDPVFTGLHRDHTLDGSLGLVHPTAAGANGSLGLVLATCHLIRAHDPKRRLRACLTMIPHAALLLIAQSRSALGVSVFCVGLLLMWGLTSRAKGGLMLLAALALTVAFVADPGFQLLGRTLDISGEFVARGQTASELKAVSGRTEMWAAVWEQFESSMLIGHGYFVTSASGRLDVWHGPNNYTAHNILLQLLVSTGVIGTALFSYGMVRLVWPIVSNWDWRGILRLPPGVDGVSDPGSLRLLALVMTVWYFGWSITCIAFIGPVRTESVVFFTVLGLLLSLSLDEVPATSRLVHRGGPPR